MTPPTISGFAPKLGPTTGGAEVLILGTHLTGVTAVKFGTTSARFTVESSTAIVATTPVHAAGTATVSVASPGGTASASGHYTFVTSPTISPTAGPTTGGTTVTITGSHLTGTTAVSFGTTPATFTATSTTITAKTPAHAAGTVVVTIKDDLATLTASNDFTYVTPPTTSGFAPKLGSTTGGQEVLILGTHLTRVTAVKFGTTSARFTVESSTAIVATTPAHTAGSVKISVTSPGGTATATGHFTFVTAPTISPTAGLTTGGTTVTITGSHLTGTTAVSFGTTAATTFTATSTTITVTTPPHAAGTVVVTIKDDLATLTASNDFSYVASE